MGATIFLSKQDWNDWFKWETLYRAVVVDSQRGTTELGLVKIAKRSMAPSSGATPIPQEFSALSEEFFSLGQDENYYETLNSLGADFRDDFLTGIRDCAYNLSILRDNLSEPVLTNSLLRDIPLSRVEDRFNRLAHGNPVLSKYSFSYQLPPDERSLDGPPTFDFEVKPYAHPPTNVHVLIGRNGVGKSRCFDLLSRAMLGLPGQEPTLSTGLLKSQKWSTTQDDDDQELGFAGFVSVSFSAFDNVGPLVQKGTTSLRYDYVGLKRYDQTTKSKHELTEEFVSSVGVCREGVRAKRWAAALGTLEADPLFEEEDVSRLADPTLEEWESEARSLFGPLSSGHSVVLFIITKLIELVEERSLVLIDEPEAHLHPPLLSAFVRALSDLMTQRNGVAIVATHSPVVLQEVPRSCVWILSRSGFSSRADRPEIETFGENVGILTREVFELEVTRSGFHRMISEALDNENSVESTIGHFDGQLGSEARALVRALFRSRQSDAEKE